ncbi:MAG TPA: hypothetical protein DIS90_08070 [Cytophagales bacterium]|nr:hypothetical protein [Cytophagales bacterium]
MDQKLGQPQIGVLQHIIDNLPAVVFQYSIFPDGSRDFTYLSPRCEEILGLKKEILLSGALPMSEFIHEDDLDSLEEVKDRCIQTLSEFNWEGRISFNGNIVWVEAKGSPKRLNDNSIVFSGIITDVSKRKEIELRERLIEKEYKNLLEFLPIGAIVHRHGKLLYANERIAEILGAINGATLIGREMIDFVHPEFRSVVQQRMKSVTDGNAAVQIEAKYLRVDGRSIDVLSSALPVSIAGEVSVLNIILDVTGQKEAEAEIRKTEMLFTQLFNNAPLAVVMLDANGIVMNVNRGFQEMFGFSLGELQGGVLEKFIVPPGLEDEGSDLNSLISSYNVAKIETVRKSKDNQLLSVIIYGVPVRLEDKTIGIFGLYVDITERKKVEEELKVRNSELDNFVYKVSHDLRAPLSSILGLVNLAKMPNNNDSLDQYIEIVGRKALQLDHFIGDVLSHSKNLKMEIKLCEIDFNQIINDSFSDLTYLSGAELVSKKILISGIEFYSDLWRIKEIFRNLISNSIKYRNDKTSQVDISINIQVDTKCATITFSDNGIGIDEDKVNNIFEMFYRASEVSTGSGLGLYIVKNAVEKLKGTIEVESAPNKGTTFTIMIPNEQLI